MSVDMPDDLHSWMREIERRLRVQETAVRVPSLGSADLGRAVQTAVDLDGVLASTGVVTAADLDGSGELAVTVSAQFSGRAVVLFGSTISAGPASTDIATMEVVVTTSLGIFSSVGQPVARVSGPNRASASAARYVPNLPGESGIKFAAKFSKTTGAWTASFRTPYLIVIPI